MAQRLRSGKMKAKILVPSSLACRRSWVTLPSLEEKGASLLGQKSVLLFPRFKQRVQVRPIIHETCVTRVQ
eukprot:scaffold13631_cov38-Cyclotella_meneghiniana.AAC.6